MWYSATPGCPGWSVIRWWARWRGWRALAARSGRCGASACFFWGSGPPSWCVKAGPAYPCAGFGHNPMVLVQSIAESALSYFAVYWVLVWLNLPTQVAGPLALVALVASPAVLTRVVADPLAAGPVTERAIVLTTLSTLYALTLGSASVQLANRPSLTLLEAVYPVVAVLGVSIVVAALLTLVLRVALRLMSPTSENTAMLFLALVAAGTAVAAHMGGSAPLAALLGGMLLKQINPRPWAWPRQLGNASSLLTMLMFVLVSTVAAQADWNAPVAGVVLALIAVRLLAKASGVALGNVGSGASWQQALWVGCAMTPMSSIALLIASQFVLAAPAAAGQVIASVALPAILLMEMSGAIIATVAIYRAGESSIPWAPLARGPNGDSHGSCSRQPILAADTGWRGRTATGQNQRLRPGPLCR